jgi:hypothetical protein
MSIFSHRLHVAHRFYGTSKWKMIGFCQQAGLLPQLVQISNQDSVRYNEVTERRSLFSYDCRNTDLPCVLSLIARTLPLALRTRLQVVCFSSVTSWSLLTLKLQATFCHLSKRATILWVLISWKNYTPLAILNTNRHTYKGWSGSSVGVVTRLWVRKRIDFRQGKRFLSSPLSPDRFCNPPSLLSNVY